METDLLRDSTIFGHQSTSQVPFVSASFGILFGGSIIFRSLSLRACRGTRVLKKFLHIAREMVDTPNVVARGGTARRYGLTGTNRRLVGLMHRLDSFVLYVYSLFLWNLHDADPNANRCSTNQ
jgi:hypothetical protein